MGSKVLLNLTRFDAEPAELDLLVEATEKLKGTVGSAPHPVAGAVEASPATIDEAFVGELWLVKVTASETFPGEPQLAGDSDRYRFPWRSTTSARTFAIGTPSATVSSSIRWTREVMVASDTP